jgi:hypothetical protein
VLLPAPPHTPFFSLSSALTLFLAFFIFRTYTIYLTNHFRERDGWLRRGMVAKRRDRWLRRGMGG